MPWPLAVEDYAYTGYVAYCCMFIMIFIDRFLAYLHIRGSATLIRLRISLEIYKKYTRVGDFDTPTHQPTSPIYAEYMHIREEVLPQFTPLSTPNFRWGDMDGKTFSHSIDRSYEEIVHWRRNLFKIPSGKAGKAFIRELTHLFQAYADGSALESVAMNAAMVMPALLLQKPHSRSKAKEHTLHLERRLRLWIEGDLEGLLKEGRTIQHQFTRQHPNRSRSAQQITRRFAKLMMEGKVRAAL